MSLNLIAILISLAMMLTGAGGEGQPAEAARTLTLRDVSLTFNGERVSFDPVIRLGASSDGQSALFDFGIDADGGTLLPVQVAVDESGVTALFEKSDVAVNVAAQALEALTANITIPTAETDDSGMMTFMTQEYFPAYVNLLTAMNDEAFVKEMQEKANAIVDGIIDRGEGKPVTEEVEGKTVELTEYVYTVDSAQMARLSDAILTSNDTFKAYYDAVFAMFAKMPEETGLSGIASYADMFEKTGLEMSMEIDEKRSDDGEIQITDAALKMDMSAMIKDMAAEGEEVPEMPPMVMNIHGVKSGENQVVSMDMAYQADEVEMELSMSAVQGDDSMMVDMTMEMYQSEELMGYIHMDIGKAADAETGSAFTHVNMDFDMGEQGAFECAFLGTTTPDGASEGDFSIGVKAADNAIELAFVAEVAPNAIENRVTGHAIDLAIDDLSQEGMSALAQDEAAGQALTKVTGTMMADVQKLMSDEGVQALTTLFTLSEAATEAAIEDEGDADYEVELTEDENGELVLDLGDLEFVDDGDMEYDDYEDYEEIEDDGVLGFNVPKLTWLPEGWTEAAHTEDTAYDWADISVTDKTGADSMYALFFADTDDTQKNYIIGDDGAVSPVEGREISVTDFGEEGVSVAWHMNGLYYNLVFYTNAVDLDTIGKIVAGIQP